MNRRSRAAVRRSRSWSSFVVRRSSVVVRRSSRVRHDRARSVRLQPDVCAAPLPELTKPVNDFANVIDPADEQRLDEMIRSLQAASGDVVVDRDRRHGRAVRRPPRIRREAVREPAAAASAKRGKDNGVLILRRAEGTARRDRGRLRARRVHHRRLRRRDQPRLHRPAVPQRPVRRRADRRHLADHRQDRRRAKHRAERRAAAGRAQRGRRSGFPVPLIIAIFIAIVLMSRRRRRTARREAILGRRRLERLVERRRTVWRRGLDPRRLRRRVWRAAGSAAASADSAAADRAAAVAARAGELRIRN